jgi:histidine ammonia-lyase
MTFTLSLDGSHLTIDQLGDLAESGVPGAGGRRVQIDPEAMARVREAHERVRKLVAGDKAVYGVNTGFGPLCSTRIAADQLDKLQENLLISHAVGVGDPLPAGVVRAMLAIKINSLIQGFSGVSAGLVEMLAKLLEADFLPVIPEKGSVGSSGDLAPLSHLGIALLGHGRVWLAGEEMDASAALARMGLKPWRFGPKEALSLINGTQLMSATGAVVLHRARRLAKTADIVAAMSIDALMGSVKPFDARLAAARPHPGHLAVASNVRKLLKDSEILESHRDCAKVQDPYSMRCVPQIHGACRDAMDYAARAVEIEINSATDNPLIFEDGSAIGGGNFHGEPLAIALDTLAMAMAEFANVSERRCHLLIDGRDGLPKLLVRETGVNSGFMIPQYTAAALVSENKVLCHPASVDSIPTSLGQEDLNSMGAIAANKARQVLENSETVLAIEALFAAQALDFRAPLKSSAGVEAARRRMRLDISFAEADRLFVEDIRAALSLSRSGALVEAAEAETGSLR